MIIPTSEIRQAGDNLIEISSRISGLLTRANSISNAIDKCYMRGGIDNRASVATARMQKEMTLSSQKGKVLHAAVTIYENKEQKLESQSKTAAKTVEEGYSVSWTQRPEIKAILSAGIKTIYAISAPIGVLATLGAVYFTKTGQQSAPASATSEPTLTEEDYGVAKTLAEEWRYLDSIEINDNPIYPNNRARQIVPQITNVEGKRNVRAYNDVINSFDVENRARYQQDPNGNTWCNVYVSDVTYAMGCEIPHYYNPQTGAPMQPDEPGGRYTSAAGIRDWLNTFGTTYGWRECDSSTAQSMANQGYPAMALDTTGAHVAMIAPQREGDIGIQISQAGWKNFNHEIISYGWGSGYQLKYYYHN